MRTGLLMLAMSSLLIVCGCEKKQEPPPTQRLEIRAPGVDVTFDKEHGLHVKAGETEVDANKGAGVKVKAPGVDVEAQREKTGDE